VKMRAGFHLHELSAVTLAFIAFGAAFLAPAAPSAEDYKHGDDARIYAELSKVPAKDRNRANPLANDRDAVAAGSTLYDQHCADCHGGAGEGSRKGPSLLKPPVQNATPGTLFWLLTNGSVWRGMPVWSKLPEPQRWQLVTFIKSMSERKTGEAVPVDRKIGATRKVSAK
jgi:mono/diheme cytochrome c family protein